MRKFLFTLMVFISFFVALVSCKKDDIDTLPEGTVWGDVRELKSRADNSTVDLATTIIGAIPAELKNGIASRFKKQGPITDETRVVIVTPSSMAASTSDIMKVYNNKGIIVVADPDHTLINDWCKKQGINLVLGESVDNDAFFVFCSHLDTYILDDIPKNVSVNEYLNSLTAWINGNHNHKTDNIYDYTSKDVKVLFNAQQSMRTDPFRLKEEVAHVILSTPDSLEGNGQTDLRLSVYPLYVFDSQADNGDYYIVNATIVVHSSEMYRGNMTARHGGVRVRLCGFYLKRLDAEFAIHNNYGVAVGEFPTSGLPTPKTTVGQTEYSSGVTWSIGGSITGGVDSKGPKVEASINGGVSFTNVEKRSISDIDIRNNSIGNKAIYSFVVNNLPHYNASDISITNPPLVSISNVEFTASWIWRVPTTKDYDDKTSYFLSAKIDPMYESCHFYSTGADFSEKKHSASSGKSFSIPLKRPNRTPTGFIKVKNTFKSDVITDVKIWNVNSPDPVPYLVSSKQFASSETFVDNLPIGTYKIEFKAGPNATSLKTYELSRNITITRGDETALTSAFDFVLKK